jgi:hypothetical protein
VAWQAGVKSNAIARSLATGCTHTLACLAPNLTDFAFARIGEGAEAGCRQHCDPLLTTMRRHVRQRPQGGAAAHSDSRTTAGEVSITPSAGRIDHSSIHGTKIDKGRWFTQR